MNSKLWIGPFCARAKTARQEMIAFITERAQTLRLNETLFWSVYQVWVWSYDDSTSCRFNVTFPFSDPIDLIARESLATDLANWPRIQRKYSGLFFENCIRLVIIINKATFHFFFRNYFAYNILSTTYIKFVLN